MGKKRTEFIGNRCEIEVSPTYLLKSSTSESKKMAFSFPGSGTNETTAGVNLLPRPFITIETGFPLSIIEARIDSLPKSTCNVTDKTELIRNKREKSCIMLND